MTPAAPAPFTAGQGLAIRGETAGEGLPVVLCHGLTETRSGVVHGSHALERAGQKVISYDARGHGESDPAPTGEGYGYSELVADLGSVVEAMVDEGRFVLAGSSMGAHTAAAYALQNPERPAGLVLIGPAYDGTAGEGELAYWDGLAAALERGGVDGFVGYMDRARDFNPAWRDTVLRFTRERMLRHRRLDAVAEALRQVPRSRPFDELGELEALAMPVLVVASQDDSDASHPRAVAEAYAERPPRARLIGEAAGESPLAWQGGRLSRAIAGFCAELTSPADR